MAATDATTRIEKSSFSKSFFDSLYEMEAGDRIKTCLQCATCSGICPFGFLMKFPPGRMIGLLRADRFRTNFRHRFCLDVCILLCLYGCMPQANSINNRVNDTHEGRNAACRERSFRATKRIGIFTTLWESIRRIAP